MVPALGRVVAAALGTDRHPGRRVGRHAARRLAAWLDWHRVIAPDNAAEIRALEADAGSISATFESWAAAGPTTPLPEPIVSVPTQYERKPLLRGGIE